jgi:hypothetical protein
MTAHSDVRTVLAVGSYQSLRSDRLDRAVHRHCDQLAAGERSNTSMPLPSGPDSSLPLLVLGTAHEADAFSYNAL